MTEIKDLIEKINALPKNYDDDLCHAWTPMNVHQCQSDGFKLSDLKALALKLEEAERELEKLRND